MIASQQGIWHVIEMTMLAVSAACWKFSSWKFSSFGGCGKFFKKKSRKAKNNSHSMIHMVVIYIYRVSNTTSVWTSGSSVESPMKVASSPWQSDGRGKLKMWCSLHLALQEKVPLHLFGVRSVWLAMYQMCCRKPLSLIQIQSYSSWQSAEVKWSNGYIQNNGRLGWKWYTSMQNHLRHKPSSLPTGSVVFMSMLAATKPWISQPCGSLMAQNNVLAFNDRNILDGFIITCFSGSFHSSDNE